MCQFNRTKQSQVCSPNNKASKYMNKNGKITGKTDHSSIIVGDLNTLLSEIDRKTRQKPSKKLDLNKTIIASI